MSRLEFLKKFGALGLLAPLALLMDKGETTVIKDNHIIMEKGFEFKDGSQAAIVENTFIMNNKDSVGVRIEPSVKELKLT